jgi:subtilisin family serine protease
MNKIDTLRITIELFGIGGVDKAIAAVQSHGGRIDDGSMAGHVRLFAHLDGSALPELAKTKEIYWVGGFDDIEFFNGQAQWVIQSGQSDQRPIWDKGLKGQGQVVGVGDTGVDYDHSFFRDPGNWTPGPNHRKIIAYKAWYGKVGDTFGHGTHTAGSIAGNDRFVGGTSANIGEAPEAKLFVDDLGTLQFSEVPKDMNVFFNESYNGTARIHSDSWGWPGWYNYSYLSTDTDEFMWNHKDFLPVIAAGNERGSSTSLRSPGTAKDVVTVGATSNGASANDMAYFSSTGPTLDGRLKPTVCAPGENIISAQSDYNLNTNNSGEVSMSGTSMATPTTAGGVALIRQYFTEGWYPTGAKNPTDSIIPTAALMKATLMAGATEITGTGSDYNVEGKFPNNSQGWGRVFLDGSLYFSGDASKLVIFEEKTGITTGTTKSYGINVSSTTQPLKIILVWTDYNGQLNANPAIVNNLDLEVKDPTSVIYKGNVFAGQSPGHSVIGGSADTLNVEEGVLLPNVADGLKTGHYDITVKGTNIPQGSQPFAIAVVGDVQESHLARIGISPNGTTISADDTQQFTAQGYDQHNNPLSISPGWTTSNGSISASGLFSPYSTGVIKITATSGSISGNASITVIPGALVSITVNPSSASITMADTVNFTANGSDAKGNLFTLAWNWATTGGVILSTGEYLPTGVGTFTVYANYSGISGTAQVSVSPAVPSTNVLDPLSIATIIVLITAVTLLRRKIRRPRS